jgi:hypothetical protein
MCDSVALQSFKHILANLHFDTYRFYKEIVKMNFTVFIKEKLWWTDQIKSQTNLFTNSLG